MAVTDLVFKKVTNLLSVELMQTLKITISPTANSVRTLSHPLIFSSIKIKVLLKQ
jgi:hypothetical protein